MKIHKQAVIKIGLSNTLFPEKTTYHLITNRQRDINFNLKKIL